MNFFSERKFQHRIKQFILTFAALVFFALPALADAPASKAEEGDIYKLQIRIGDTSEIPIADGICHWILALYNYLIAASGVLAAFFITLGGFRYVLSGGHAEQVGQAKENIVNGVVGMMLVLSAYILLNTINPALLICKMPEISKIETIEMAGDDCPLTKEFECGKSFTSKDSPKIQKGISCLGRWCDNGGKCVQSMATSLGEMRQTKVTKSYDCVDVSKCPNGPDDSSNACQSIVDLFGDKWTGVCAEHACDFKIKSGCYLLKAGNTQSVASNCLPKPDLGQSCNDEEGIYCRIPYLCKDNHCAPGGKIKNLGADANCTDASQCESGMCNFAINKGEPPGKCVRTGGYKNKSPCMVAEGAVCGNSWGCVPTEEGSKIGTCSDRKLNSGCNPNVTQPCASSANECKLVNEYYICVAKPKPVGEDCVHAGECESKKCCKGEKCAQNDGTEEIKDGKCVDASVTPPAAGAASTPPPATPPATP